MRPTWRILLKKLIAANLEAFKWPERIIKRRTGKQYAILMYHRVLASNERADIIQDGMYVSAETFETHLRTLKQLFSIVPLCDLETGSSHPTIETFKPKCALTFDDGWSDFFKNAYPILLKHHVPATVFLPTGYIGSDRLFWTDKLAQLLKGRHNHHSLSGSTHSDYDTIVTDIEAIKGPLSHQIETGIGMLKAFDQDRIEQILNALKRRWGNSEKRGQKAFITWAQARIMYQSGLISFGSHTVDHHILTTLSGSRITEELNKSKQTLIDQGVMLRDFMSFCYPNGNHNGMIVDLVRMAGYNLAVTTRSGWNDHQEDLFMLRRVPIHQDMTSNSAMFKCKLSGIL